MYKQHVELSDYHLWLCQQIREKIAEGNYLGISPFDTEIYSERDLVTIALSELAVRLNSTSSLINEHNRPI